MKIFSSLMIIILILLLIPNSLSAKSKQENIPEIKIESERSTNWCPELKIGLYTLNFPFNVSVNLDCNIINPLTNKKIKSLQKNKSIKLSAVNNQIKIDNESTACSEIEIRPISDVDLRILKTSIGGTLYFGGLKLIAQKNNLVVINIVPVEEYLRGVLPKEMSPSWNEEALKAQVIAARTFALKNRNRHKNDGYDLCSTVHCQAYDGIESTHERTDSAIKSTFGQVLYFNGKLIEAPFHTDSGGITESALEVWGTDYPYLRPVTEIKSKTTYWELYFTAEELTKQLDKKGFKIGDVKLIKVTNLELGKMTNDRTASGRVKELTIVGSTSEVKLSGDEVREIFGLKSTLFDVSINGDGFKFIGYGWGHGVGMSQYGALNLAENKYSFNQILAYYYKGTEIKRLY